MLRFDFTFLIVATPILALAAVAPVVFPAALAGYATMKDLALMLMLPAALLLVALALWHQSLGSARLAGTVWRGTLAGVLATIALEAIRYPGFRLGFMPGNLPELMGVLLLDRFAEGPSTASTVAGYGYHFWNGASFGIVFSVIAESLSLRRFKSWAAFYGVLVGIGFLASPVVQSLGGGLFGLDFGAPFLSTVISAHIAYGVALGVLLKWMSHCETSDSRDAATAWWLHASRK
jgi:hypothetical protein